MFPITSFIFHAPPSARTQQNLIESGKLPNRGASAEFVLDVKLQEECCEQWVSDAGKVLSILLCDFASLIRLSITIRLLANSQTPGKQWNTLGCLRGELYHSESRRSKALMA